jgi:alkanesulfonate monooxygenase SsuD/methylene tetrahydromethanopterin reductase-like flavin-dependent oxidoreductase (luciferase family)
MEFGVFDWIDRDPLALADNYEQRLEVLAAADELGYWCYHLAEHHGTPLGMAPEPGLFLAAATQRTRRIRLGPLVYLLPLYNPVRLAEEICMLDHLSRGRLELGFGRGASPYELGMLNVDVAETKAMFDEGLAIILMALTSGRVDYAGQYYTFKDVQLPTRPYQQPYPPLWYPTSNPDSTPWVARHGFSTLWTYTSRDLDEQQRMIATYGRELAAERDRASALNRHVPRPRNGLVRHVCVAARDEEAMAAGRAAWGMWHESFNYLWRLHGNPRHENSVDFDASVANGMALVGSPATVRARLRAQVDATGGNYFAGCFSWGSLTLEQQLTSLRLFAEQVVPAFAAA